MGKSIGAAADFYRLRVVRIDVTDEPDLEWREDILYREPPTQMLDEYESYAIEAVSVDDEDNATRIAVYETSDAAYDALGAIQDDLDELTRSRFEERYLVGAE